MVRGRGGGRGLICYRGMCLEELGETTKNLIRDDSRCPERDSKRVHLECQSVLPFKVTHDKRV
jgi:hypothetical protein